MVLGPWHGLVKARQVALPLHRWFDSLGQSSDYSGQHLPGKQEGSRIAGLLLVLCNTIHPKISNQMQRR